MRGKPQVNAKPAHDAIVSPSGVTRNRFVVMLKRTQVQMPRTRGTFKQAQKVPEQPRHCTGDVHPRCTMARLRLTAIL
jgi:hypothetical protein